MTGSGVVYWTTPWLAAFIFGGVLLVFCGLRSGIADTGTYIGIFRTWPTNVAEIDWSSVTMDKGFYFVTVLFRQFVSTDFHPWLFIIALISIIPTIYAFKTYASDFGMTAFLFIATTSFVYLVNGMRQYICMAVMLACSRWIIEKKYLRFILVCLILSTVHASVLVFIPVCLVVNARPWGVRMQMVILLAVLAGLRFDYFWGQFGGLLTDTLYEGYIDFFKSGDYSGSTIIRLLVALVPVIIAFIARKYIESCHDPMINMAINMSAINACFYFIATFTSGMAVGRVCAYFDIYNLLLLPWLVNNVFTRQSSRIIKAACIVLYTAYFYYQMVVTWHLPYVSDVLNLYLY